MQKKSNLIIAYLMLAAISMLHFITPPKNINIHILLRFLYLIPIVYAGIKCEKHWGLYLALTAVLLYIPHFYMKDAPSNFHIENAIGMLIFILVGFMFEKYKAIKTGYIRTKYKKYPFSEIQEKGTVLFYADDSPISVYCAKWLGNNLPKDREIKINILYGPRYACVDESSPTCIENGTFLKEAILKNIIEYGFNKDSIQEKAIELKNKERLSSLIVKEATSINCGLIIIGKHRLTKAQEFLFGDTAINLIRESPIPVTVITARANKDI